MIIDHPTGQFTRSSSYSYTLTLSFAQLYIVQLLWSWEAPTPYPYPLPLAETTLIEHSWYLQLDCEYECGLQA